MFDFHMEYLPLNNLSDSVEEAILLLNNLFMSLNLSWTEGLKIKTRTQSPNIKNIPFKFFLSRHHVKSIIIAPNHAFLV